MTLKASIKSMRLRTLPLSLSGVILGVTLAADKADVSPWTAALIFLTTVCLQILSNLSNELGDTLNGTDSADRQGPQYALGSGDMTVGDIKKLIGIFIVLCIVSGLAMISVSFRSIFKTESICLEVLGAAAIVGAMKYTLGKNPYGYRGLGDMSVLLDVLRHAVLPALALGLLTAGVFIRLVRTNVIATYNSGYVEAARSRGVSEKRLLNKHAWKPALIPIITVMGMQIALMLAGAVLTETTFEWKGLGFMLSQYLKARDFVAVQGIVILIAIIVAVVNFIVDVIAALVDPRVRY